MNTLFRNRNPYIGPSLRQQAAIASKTVCPTFGRKDQCRYLLPHLLQHCSGGLIDINRTNQKQRFVKTAFTFTNSDKPRRLSVPQIQIIKQSMKSILDLDQRFPTCGFTLTGGTSQLACDSRKIKLFTSQFNMLAA